MSYLQTKRDKRLKPLAKALRHNMTKEECHLWFDFLHDYPVRILRQKIIQGYIVDFYCAKAKLVIELDGSQHYETEIIEQDKKRTEILEAQGLKVIRFINTDVWDKFDDIKETIHREIEERLIKD